MTEARGTRREARGPTAEPQRRQVTLVSCQLSGFTEGGAPLDAEDVGELELAFHELCVEVIERHGGSVALSMGGEVLASFGWTQGREDDSERAVRAGLQLTRELRDTLQRRLPHLPLSGLSVRGGVHTEEGILEYGRAPPRRRPAGAALEALARGEAPVRQHVVGDLGDVDPEDVLVGEVPRVAGELPLHAVGDAGGPVQAQRRVPGEEEAQELVEAHEVVHVGVRHEHGLDREQHRRGRAVDAAEVAAFFVSPWASDAHPLKDLS